MDKQHGSQSNDDNTESPSSYGKEAYKEYRIKEKIKEKSGTLGDGYNQKRSKIALEPNYASIIAQVLKDLKFPAKKEQVVRLTLNNKSASMSTPEVRDVLALLQQIQEKEYTSMADLVDSIGLLRDVS
jgi:uncharacterized protein DUF2795